MIVQLKGNVQFPLTLDPSVWIFDDRKIILDEAFQEQAETNIEDDLRKKAEIFEEIYLSKNNKPPVQKTVAKHRKEDVLKHSYVIPLKDFVLNAEPNENVERVILHRKKDTIIISYEQLVNAYALFAIDGKPLVEDGPIYIIFGDGSNQAEPIKNIQSIEIK